ncbi:sensor histidine kinase [Clostridium sp.]|uniref:sensor histidine kinase n=1 Tax=Clostridium sp. TaxID=1506 RepID=UPI003F37FE86
MDNKVKLLKQIIYIAGVTLISMVLFYNKHNNAMFILCLSLMMLWWIEGTYFNEKMVKYIYGLWIMEYSVILIICSREATGMSILLLLLMIGGIVLSYPLKKSIFITIIAYMGYIIMMRFFYKEQYDAYNLFMTTMNFIIVYLLISAIRYQMLQRGKAQETSKELKEKTEELENAYNKLQEFYENKEEMILLKERNRIAGEIHDTVGHRLTTVIVQLEATKRLMYVDQDKASEKLVLTQTLVREGLQDIRQAVRAMKEDKSMVNFEEYMKVFIDEVSNNNNVIIESYIETLPALNDKIKNMLLRGLQEGITNGIRHGKSKWFKVDLVCDNDEIQLNIQDRGVGNEELEFGFGLYNIDRKVKELKGTFEVKSHKENGTSLFVKLPIKGGE